MLSKKRKFAPKPTIPRAVEYWKHFPRNFLTMYGPAKPALIAEQVFKRLQPFSCEWLLRPKVAVSEMASTISGNCKLLNESKAKILDEKETRRLTDTFKPIVKSLERLNSQDIESEEPTKNDIVKIMEFFIQDNEKFDKLIDETYETASALFSLTTHAIVARTLLRDPDEYSQKIEMHDNRDKAFKKKPSITTLKQLLIDECIGEKIGKKKKEKSRKSLIQELKRSKRKGEKTSHDTSAYSDRTSVESLTSGETSDSSLPAKKKRKENEEVSSSASLEELTSSSTEKRHGKSRARKKKPTKSSTTSEEECSFTLIDQLRKNPAKKSLLGKKKTKKLSTTNKGNEEITQAEVVEHNVETNVEEEEEMQKNTEEKAKKEKTKKKKIKKAANNKKNENV